MKERLIPLIALALLLPACGPLRFETGRPFTLTQVEGIRVGETSREAILERFGEPQLKGKNESGLELWTYLYLRAEVPFKGEVKNQTVQRITLNFDDKGRVKTISYEMSP